MVAGKKINKPIYYEVLHHRIVAVQQHNARTGGLTTVEIMNSHAFALNK